MNYKFTSIYEDNHLLAVFKPNGICVDKAADNEPNLLEDAKDYIKHKYKKPGAVYLLPVYTLDKLASGVVLFAKTSKAATRIAKQIKDNQLKKIYIALVDGVPAKEKTLINFIDRDGSKSFITKNKTKGKEAILSYRVLKDNNSTSLIEIIQKTECHHQIRVQFLSFGFPVIGDTKYGSLIPFKSNAIALHISKLQLFHPISKEPLEITCPYPKIWENFI